MNNKTEGTGAIASALLVLFSAILNPIISVIIAIATLASLGIYHLVKKN